MRYGFPIYLVYLPTVLSLKTFQGIEMNTFSFIASCYRIIAIGMIQITLVMFPYPADPSTWKGKDPRK